MRRGPFALALVALAVAACQPDQPRRPSGGDTDLPERRAREVPEAPDPEPVNYRVFNREDVPDPPRTTLHLLVDARANRGELRVTLTAAMNQVAEADPSLVAIRSIGYVGQPTARGAREADLVPIAWAEWLPPSGWYEASEADGSEHHRVYFYHGSPPSWK